MIGIFNYSPDIDPECITLEMQWQGDYQIGVLHIPVIVLELLEYTDYASIRTGETLTLPLSLGCGSRRLDLCASPNWRRSNRLAGIVGTPQNDRHR